MKSRTTTAQVVEYLVDYEGPQLILLKTNRDRFMLAHAIRWAGMADPFFGGEVPEKALEKYFTGRADLHYAFEHAFRDEYYFFDYATVSRTDETVELKRATKEDLEDNSLLPAGGIFSRSHTSLFKREKVITALKTYKIDGKWGADDFSHFYGKMSDLYALFAMLNRLEGATAPAERGFFAQALKERLWRGGGSYNGFYDDLDSRNAKQAVPSLEVSRIQYASPGQIDLRGDKDALAYTSDVIAVFEDHSYTLRKLYNEARGALQKAKLLKAGPETDFPSPAIKQFVNGKIRELAEAMKLENIDDMYAASGPNVLVFAKLVLSIFRRANELYAFEDEGRIQRT